MTALQELLAKRRSIRRYTDQPISKEDLLKCIEAARIAPSACNGQPWKFVIVDDKVLREEVCDKAFSGTYSMNKFVKDAPVLVAVVSEREKFFAAIGGFLRDTRYYLIDIGIACEHLILQATELGIGSCWIGWFDEKAVKKALKIPKHKKIDVIISLGYFQKEDVLPAKSRKPLEEISSFNSYE